MSRGIADFIANKVRKPRFVISLPYKTLKVSSTLLWEPPLITEHDLSWNYVKSALDEIIFLAKEDGSIPLIFMYPTPGVVYAQFSPLFKINEDIYLKTSMLINGYCFSKKVVYIDLNESLKPEISKHFIFVSDLDFHLNTDGVKKVFDVALQAILTSH